MRRPLRVHLDADVAAGLHTLHLVVQSALGAHAVPDKEEVKSIQAGGLRASVSVDAVGS